MTKVQLAIALALGATLLPGAALAQPPDLEGRGMAEEVTAVVVTPSRGPEARFTASRSVDRVGRRDLRERQVETAFDALRESPGAMVQQTNRGAGIPVIRGLVGPSNLVVVDGLRFNQATWRTGPSQYLTMLDPSAFSAYELLPGPASVRYGGGAMGGVTSAVPWALPRRQGWHGTAGLRFVSEDTGGSGWLHAGGRVGDLSIGLGGAWREHGTLRMGGGEALALSDWRQQAWHGRAAWHLSPQTTIDLAYRGTRVRHAGRVDRLAEGRMRIYDNDDDYAALNLRHKGTGRVRAARLALAWHQTDERVARFDCVDKHNADLERCVSQADALWSSPSADPGDTIDRERRYDDQVMTLGGLGSLDVSLIDGRLDLSLGAEAWSDRVTESTLRSRRLSDAHAWKDSSRGNFSEGTTWLEAGAWAWLAATVWQRGDLRLLVGAGARVTHFRGDASGVPGLGEVSWRHTGLVGAGDVRLVAKDRWMLYLDVSQGFRAPNVQETTVLGDTGQKFEVPNADLGPEKGLTLELGGRLSLRRVRLHASVWVNNVDGFIGEQEMSDAEISAAGLDPAALAGQQVVQRVNRDGGRFVGAQGRVDLPLGMGLTPYALAGWSQGDITLADGSTMPGRRVAPLIGQAGVRYRKGRLWLDLYSRFAGKQERLHDVDRGDRRICADPAAPHKTYAGDTCPGTPGWATLNLRGGWRFSKRLALDVLLANALDTNYRVHGSGFDAPGIGVSASLTGRY